MIKWPGTNVGDICDPEFIWPYDVEVPLDQIGHDSGRLRDDVAPRSITMKCPNLVHSHDPCDAMLAASFASLSKIQEDPTGTPRSRPTGHLLPLWLVLTAELGCP